MVKFEEERISYYETLNAGDIVIEYPVLRVDELKQAIEGVRKAAQRYRVIHDDPMTSALISVQKTLETWIKWAKGQPDASLEEKVRIVSAVTGTSPEMIKAFGIYPLSEMNLTLIPEAQKQLEMILRDNPSGINPYGEGYITSVLAGWKERFQIGGIRGLLGIPRLMKEPGLILQLMPGNVVGPTWLAYSLGPGQIVKVPSDDPASNLVFLDTLAIVDPELRKSILACYWKGGDTSIEDIIFKLVDMIQIMGGDTAVRDVQKRAHKSGIGHRTYPHGHTISFGYVASEFSTPEIAKLSALSAIANDSLACYSPTVIFVQRGGQLTPEEYAVAISEEMKILGEIFPHRQNPSLLISVQKYIEREAISHYDSLIFYKDDHAVIFNPKIYGFSSTCGNRVIRVVAVDGLSDILPYLEEPGRLGNLQSAEIAVPQDYLLKYFRKLARVGVTNVHAPGEAFVLSPYDPHDGIFNGVKLILEEYRRWSYLSFRNMESAIDRSSQRREEMLNLVAPSPEMGYRFYYRAKLISGSSA